MRVQFTETFDYRPSGAPQVTLRYRADGGPAKDGIYTVKRECGAAAVKSGSGKVVRAPRRAANV